MFPELNEANFWSHSLHHQNSGILQTRTDERRALWKWILIIFKHKSENTNRAQKADKKWVICLIFFFSSWVKVLKLFKIVHFCKFVLTSTRNLNLLKQSISIHLKDFIVFFQKIVFFIRVRARIHKILKNKISKKVLAQQKFNNIHQIQALISSKLYIMA